jgi:coproporphyrinogen III oxidase-like Fe-S oxidoreductase
VSTVAGRRWQNAPAVGAYLQALAAGQRPRREIEHLDAQTRTTERVLLGLRLDEPLALDTVAGGIDHGALARVEQLGLAVRERRNGAQETIALTPRGRLLGGGVTAELLT